MKANEIKFWTNLRCGLLDDSPAFRVWLEKFFESAKIKDDDKWWVRDWLSSAWNAALDATLGVEEEQP